MAEAEARTLTGSCRALSKYLADAGLWAARVVVRYEAFVVPAAAVACLLALAGNFFRQLWFDELFTFFISRLPDLGSIWAALPADGNPPLYYLLARMTFRLFGESEFAVRLPAVLASVAAMLAVYAFIRRRSGPLFALLAMALLAYTSDFVFLASEARPYSLMLAFTGLALVCWQAAAETTGRRSLPLIGLGIGVAGAICSHHYGSVHVGVPLLVGETVRLINRRRPDLPMCCAAAAGMSMFIVTLPLVFASNRVMLDHIKRSTVFWARPSLAGLCSYGGMTSLWLPAVFIVLLWLTRPAFPPVSSPDRRVLARSPVPRHEAAAALGLALLIPIVIGLSYLATGYYTSRYAIGTALGIALLAGLFAPALARSMSHAAAAAALCLILVGARQSGRLLLPRLIQPPPVNTRSQPLLATAPGSDPIVVAYALVYMPAWWYSPPELRARLHYLADPSYAVTQPEFVAELSLVANRAFIPSKADDYRQFVTAHRRFLLYSVGAAGSEWTVRRLAAEGWSLQPIRSVENNRLYLVLAPGGEGEVRQP
jgi:4-amino-4-deoxy-L-arabinose transferase-like glycosyltransferase